MASQSISIPGHNVHNIESIALPSLFYPPCLILMLCCVIAPGCKDELHFRRDRFARHSIVGFIMTVRVQHRNLNQKEHSFTFAVLKPRHQADLRQNSI